VESGLEMSLIRRPSITTRDGQFRYRISINTVFGSNRRFDGARIPLYNNNIRICTEIVDETVDLHHSMYNCLMYKTE